MNARGLCKTFSVWFCYFILAQLWQTYQVSCATGDYTYEVEEGLSDGGGDSINAFIPLEINNWKWNGSSSGFVAFDIGVVVDGYRQATVPSHSTGLQSYNSTGVDESKFQSKLSSAGDHVFGTLLIVIGFLSFVGNGSILLVFSIRFRRLSPAEVFLVNLGVVDLLLSMAGYPLSMIASFKHRWAFGDLGCTLYAFTCYFLGLASIFSITAIALVRYLKTCNPAKGNAIDCWKSCKMISWTYVFAFVWAAAPLLGFGHYGLEPFRLSCTLDWVARDQASQIYIVLVTVLCVFLPLIIITFCYTRIILLVKQSDSLLRSNGVNKRNMRGSDVQLTWITGLVTLGFILGWGPYTVVSLWASFRGEVILPLWATPIPVLMAKSSIAYNPIIYTFFTSRYREDVMHIIRNFPNCGQNNSHVSKKPTGNNDADNGEGDSLGVTGNSLMTKQITSITSAQKSPLNSHNHHLNEGSSPNGRGIQLNNYDTDDCTSDECGEREREASRISVVGGKVITTLVNDSSRKKLFMGSGSLLSRKCSWVEEEQV